MESDKWIRKLFALLVEMGFELQSPQSHRKVIYKGDKLKKPCSLVIQSHAKESSKRDIMSYIKRTLRAADAPPEMIERLNSFPIGFVADGMTIQQIDQELYDAISKKDVRLIAEVAVELGKAISEQGADSYQIEAFNLMDAEAKRLDEVYKCFVKTRDMLQDIFEQAFLSYTESHGYLVFTTDQYGNICCDFDADVCEKYSFEIVGFDKTSDEIIIKGLFTGDLGEMLNNAGYSKLFEVSFFGNADRFRCVVSSKGDIAGFDIEPNWNLSAIQAQELVDKVDQERVFIFLR